MCCVFVLWCGVWCVVCGVRFVQRNSFSIVRRWNLNEILVWSIDEMMINKERQKNYDTTLYVSLLLREIPSKVYRVWSCDYVARNPRQAIRNLSSFYNSFFNTHCCSFCGIFDVLLFNLCFYLNYCLHWLSFSGWRNETKAKSELHFLIVHTRTGHEGPEGE